jgi:hypothetical protein
VISCPVYPHTPSLFFDKKSSPTVIILAFANMFDLNRKAEKSSQPSSK